MVALLSDFPKVPRVLRLNVAGLPIDWISWQEAVCLYSRNIVVWTLGDPVLQIRGGRARLVVSKAELKYTGLLLARER